MSSSPTPQANSFLNHPLINTITGYVARLQEQNLFSKQRLNSLKHHFLITIGFLVILYCSIHIQFFIFWVLKLLFRLIFKIISIIFWLPLKSVRFFIPKSIDYDILFPVFWLCSIISFYISKHFHENICLFYDRYLVRRYKILNYDQTKREDIKRYLFIITFIILLLLQSLFILIPLAISIRNQHDHTKVSSTPVVVTQKTTVKTPTAKSAVKEVVETMSGNLYNRFIDAFKEENETQTNEKRPPLVSDEKLENTFKTIQKTIKDEVNKIKSTSNQEDKKTSRFQRWIIHYLKAPFQKWEGKKNEEVKNNIEQNDLEDEEENNKLDSSSLISDTEDESDDDEDDTSETDEEEHTTITERIKQRLDTVKDLGEKLKENVKNKISSSKDEDDQDSDSDEDEEDSAKPIEAIKKLSSSIDSDDDESDDDESHEELTRITNKIKEQLSKPIQKMKNIAQTLGSQIKNKLSSSTDKEDEDSGYDSDRESEEEQSSKFTDKIKETLTEPIETVKNVAANIKNKISSSSDKEDEDSDEESTPITEKIKEGLAKPIETVKDLGEQVLTNIKDKLSSSVSTDEEEDDGEVESDEEEHQSFLDQTKQKAEQIITPIKDKISSNADELKHKAAHIVDTAEDFASNILEKSSEFLKEKTEQIKENIPTTDEVLSTIKHQVVEPLESKASKIKKVIGTEAEHLKDMVVDKVKSLKKKKKPKTFTEKAKDKFKSISKSLQEKLPGHRKKQKLSKLKKLKQKLNGWFDEGWNIWHLTKRKLSHIFISSTKHARHLPRYNTTSLYTAYTDLKCYDYTKKINRYRLLKHKHLYFLNTYRHHSPFPVYLSVLKSNGPRCYRHYPDSSCGIILKTPNKSFKSQLYRFVRFWAITGIIVVILAVIYKALTHRKQNNSSSYHQHHDDFDRSSTKNQQTTLSNQNDISRSITTQKPSNINQQTISSNRNIQPLNEQIEKQLRLWLQHEQNDGFRNLSETCRIAINNAFLKQLVSYSIMTFFS